MHGWKTFTTIGWMLVLTWLGGPAWAQSSRMKPTGHYKIFFDFNDANVSKEALEVVDNAVKSFQSRKSILIEVEGHTDMSAAEVADKNLAQARADGIRDALVAKGVPRTAISSIALGASKPLVKTPKATREPLNRRAEITMYAISDVPVAAGSTKPMLGCLDYQSRGDRRVMRNTCKAAMNVQIFDVKQRTIVEQELKPNQEVPAMFGFGAVCPAGHRSDISLTPEEAAVFERHAYYCIRK